MNRTSVRVQAALRRLESLHPKKIDLSLDRVRGVLHALGNPHLAMPPVIHVAGTNGKGSTTAYLRAIAEASGRTAHVYTSPHLIRFNERIVVAGREIGDDALIDALERVETANAGGPLTFFEATTAAAFLAFAETPADIALIEVGLGGRFDATNVFDEPACAVATPVGRDHEAFLGADIAGIAREKAGVFKFGVPAVIGPQTPEARASLVAEALAVGARPIVWGKDFRAFIENDRMVYESAARLIELPRPALVGPHQVSNAGVALAAALAAYPALTDAEAAQAMQRVRWPGRLQKLDAGPLAMAARKAGGAVYIDGAHNPLGAEALAAAMADLDEDDPRPLALVIGMQRNKHLPNFLEVFQGLARTVVGVPLPGETEHWSADDIAEAAEDFGFDAASADSLTEAVAGVLALEAENGVSARVLITGSLYLVGEALALSEAAEPDAT